MTKLIKIKLVKVGSWDLDTCQIRNTSWGGFLKKPLDFSLSLFFCQNKKKEGKKKQYKGKMSGETIPCQRGGREDFEAILTKPNRKGKGMEALQLIR